MFRQVLYTQVKWTRVVLAIVAVLAFVTPAATWRLADLADGASARGMMGALSTVGPLLAMLAVVAGFVMAAQPWIVDAAAKHVYPLALPVTWTRYVGMRFAAGALTLLVPAAALWLGAVLLVAAIDLPPTLRAYPGALALRFLLGAALAYAMTFTLQYVAGRRSTLVALVILLAGIGVVMMLGFTGNEELLTRIGGWLGDWPGPFAVYLADWKLIDV